MPPLEIPLLDLVVPALIALALLAWAWRRREGAREEGVGSTSENAAPESSVRERKPAPRGPAASVHARALGALAFGLALLAAWWSIFREFAVPSESRVLAAKDWIPWCIVAAIGTAGVARIESVKRFLPSGGAPIVLALLVVLSLRVKIGQGTPGILVALLVFLAAMATWAALELSCERLRGPLPSLVLALASAGSAAAIALGGSTVIGRLCGALAAVLAVSALVARKRRAFTLSGGPVAIVSVVLVGAWINAWAFNQVPLASVGLAAAAVVVPSFAGIGPFATWTPVKRESARVLLVVLLAGAAVWIAFSARPESYGY